MSYATNDDGSTRLQCDMTADCRSTITMLDDKGFVYCEGHGMSRRGWRPCRHLRQHELNRLNRGESIARY